MLSPSPSSHQLLVLLGPTASGKTRVGVELAEAFDGEIISADSRQVFRGMDIGTGKDLEDYRQIPYHLIDILAAGEEFSLFQFQKAFYAVWQRIRQGHRLPLLVGGTGLYIDSIARRYAMREVPVDPALRLSLKGLPLDELQARLLELRPELHNSTDLLQRPRLLRAIEISLAEQRGTGKPPEWPEVSPLLFGLRWPRPELHRRIRLRLKQRIEQGMIDEAERLLAAGVSWERLDAYGLEYRYLGRYLRREINQNDLQQQLAAAINQFAKRQESFFRRMERKGVRIHWVAGDGDPSAAICARLAELGLQVVDGRLSPVGAGG